MNRILLLVAGSLFFTSAIAQTEVSTYQPGVTEDGITYFLPSTQVKVVVTATKEHFVPGEYCEYAERYLRLKNTAQSSYDQWSINDIKLYPYGVADSKKAYSIKLKSKTSAPLVGLTNDGRLLSINSPKNVTEATLPIAKVEKVNKKTINGADFKTEEILSAGSTSKMAELTANEIYNIRENRGLLTKGQADFMPKDGEQLRLMLESLDTQEQGLLQLFKGTSTAETHIFTFDINPTKDVDKVFLFNFSKYLGIVDEDDPAGTPVYYSIQDLKTLPAVNAAAGKSKKENEDLRYVIPSKVKVSIFNENKVFTTQAFPMSQFGRVEHLGGELFNKKYTTSVILSPENGGIVKIDAEKPE